MSSGRRNALIVLGLVGALAAAALAHGAGLSSAGAITAGVTALCALWWVTEPVPVPVTSLVPFVVFPLTGVLQHSEAAEAYGHHLILLLLPGVVQRSAIVVLQVERGLRFEQQLHGANSSEVGGCDEGRRVVVLLRVDVRLCSEKKRDDLVVPVFGSHE